MQLPLSIPNELRRALNYAIPENVRLALNEDMGTGDVTAELIEEKKLISATIISREPGIICGRPWVDEVFDQLNSKVTLDWWVNDGELIAADQPIVKIHGPARDILTGERTAMNFLQTLSATATATRKMVDLVSGMPAAILDTRKTLPGLRMAQKYAVVMGGGQNHRLGLFDAFLIKENHIKACDGIENAIDRAHRISPDKPVEVEVESELEFIEAREAGADTIMLDNFDLELMEKVVKLNQQMPKPAPRLEASGGINAETVLAVAKTGVDQISVGALTKNCIALDLSMRLS